MPHCPIENHNTVWLCQLNYFIHMNCGSTPLCVVIPWYTSRYMTFTLHVRVTHVLHMYYTFRVPLHMVHDSVIHLMILLTFVEKLVWEKGCVSTG